MADHLAGPQASDHPLWTVAPLSLGAGAGHQPTVSAFTVSSATPAPAMVVLPGGRYAGVADHEGAPVAGWLTSLGVAAFVLRYRVAPYRHPVPLLDAVRAMRFIRHHAGRFGIDADRVGVLGFSAGGHLAGLLATGGDALLAGNLATDPVDAHDPRPSLAVLCYPVASLTATAHAPSLANLLGPGPDPRLLRELSVEGRVSAATPPMFLWHAADDETVDAGNSLLVAAALARHRVSFELHIYPRGGHGLGLGRHQAAGAWTDACANFLRNQGW
jgi:acetyl esterase/lipase